jgi:chromosome segregation ATPase
MRRVLLSAAAALAILIVPANGSGGPQGPASTGERQAPSQSGAGPAQAEPSTAAAPSQPDSLAEAARRAKQKKKDASKPSRVFTNDNIPTAGGISSVGAAPAAQSTPASEAGGSTTSNDEKKWRDKFATLHHKLEQDQQELQVMQRELGELNLQYYNDPMKAMQQELTRSDITAKTAKIDAKKKEIEADEQAISDAEDGLRKAGGDPGWAR